MKTIAFFNNKGGVGKTTLVYHLAWMYQELGIHTVAFDLDPQANLTSAFLPEERLEQLWSGHAHPETVFGAVEPLIEHLGDINAPVLQVLGDHLALIAGDLALSRLEDRLAEAWPRCLTGDADAFRVTSAFYRIAEYAARERAASLVLMDVGPSLGALNRAALVAADYVVVPLAADLFSLQGLNNLGPTLQKWRRDWQKRRDEGTSLSLSLPGGGMKPVGYVLLQHAVRSDRPVKAYQRWAERIPHSYREQMLGSPAQELPDQPDPLCLASLRHYRSLMPLAQDARKPMFLLRAADGAIGGHAAAVADCFKDFRSLAQSLTQVCGL